MSYQSAESALLSVIRLLANYTSANSSRGDYRVLGAGVSRAVVLTPGGIRGREIIASPRRVATLWEILVELYIPFQADISTIATAITTDRQELLDHIDKYPTLNGATGIVSAFITSGRFPEIWVGEGRNWWRQVLVCEVREHTTITIAE